MTSALFYRSAAWIFLTAILVLLILNLLLATTGAERLNHLLNNLPTRVLLGALGATGAFGIIALWIGMMWNSLTLSSASIGSKIAWFLLIVFTNMLGALIYYFVVYRREAVAPKSRCTKLRLDC
jgi:Phospholipase_D-nuclease N-terminal